MSQNIIVEKSSTSILFNLSRIKNALGFLLRKLNKSSDFFDQHENKHLKDVIDKIIKKCGGWPLALVTTGGLLASKPLNKEEWEKVLTWLDFELETNSSADAEKRILDFELHPLVVLTQTLLIIPQYIFRGL
jgi:NB-ARC domain